MDEMRMGEEEEEEEEEEEAYNSNENESDSENQQADKKKTMNYEEYFRKVDPKSSFSKSFYKLLSQDFSRQQNGNSHSQHFQLLNNSSSDLNSWNFNFNSIHFALNRIGLEKKILICF